MLERLSVRLEHRITDREALRSSSVVRSHSDSREREREKESDSNDSTSVVVKISLKKGNRDGEARHVYKRKKYISKEREKRLGPNGRKTKIKIKSASSKTLFWLRKFFRSTPPLPLSLFLSLSFSLLSHEKRFS